MVGAGLGERNDGDPVPTRGTAGPQLLALAAGLGAGPTIARFQISKRSQEFRLSRVEIPVEMRRENFLVRGQ